MSSPSPVTKLIQLKADAVSHRERLSQSGPLDDVIAKVASAAKLGSDHEYREAVAAAFGEFAAWFKSELGYNLVPMFESTVDAIHDDVVSDVRDLQSAVEEILEETGDQLTEETAGLILAVFQQGRAVCNLFLELAKRFDAVTRARVEKLVKVYRTQETAVREIVEAIVLEEDEEEIAADGDEGEADAAPDDAPPAETGDETTEAPAAAQGEEG